MAQLIKELCTLPKEEQEFILNNLCHDYHPISIDGEVYMIPEKVNELIDSLFVQMEDLRYGKKNNKT